LGTRGTPLWEPGGVLSRVFLNHGMLRKRKKTEEKYENRKEKDFTGKEEHCRERVLASKGIIVEEAMEENGAKGRSNQKIG